MSNSMKPEARWWQSEKRFEITAAQKPGFDRIGVTLTQTVPMAEGAVKLRIFVRIWGERPDGVTDRATGPCIRQVSVGHF